MFESIINFFKKNKKKEDKPSTSKEAAKERLHLVLMQDRANVSADFLELMKQEIIEVIKKYIDVDEGAIDVRLTNKENEDGTNGAPALYANIPILSIKNEARKINNTQEVKEKQENKNEQKEIDNIQEQEDELQKEDLIEEQQESEKEEKVENNLEEEKSKTENVDNEEKTEKIEEDIKETEEIKSKK